MSPGSWRRQWPKKAQHWGKDVEVVPPQLGGFLHFKKASSAVSVLPFRRSVKGRKRWCNQGENGGKIHHTEEMLQLFDDLGERDKYRLQQCVQPWGKPTGEILWPKISKVGTVKIDFAKLMARPLAAKAATSASK
jgi:hypothetical protein